MSAPAKGEPVTCCDLGKASRGNVHVMSCPSVDAAKLDLGWDGLDQPYLDVTNHRDGVIDRWWPNSEFYAEVAGHLWRGDRGPYSLCHRSECRLAYVRWSGDECPGATARSGGPEGAR